ncbi:MAG: cysteine synthase A [Myxococcota bacterium]
MRANSILETIGGTPHIRLSRLFADAEVWIKLESANPGGSIKDRIALAMIERAEATGALKPDGLIVEPTSGNTGIGLAMVAAVKGYELLLVMPESMSIERRRLMAAYGAKFELTRRNDGMSGAIRRAEAIVAADDRAWMPQQFANFANPNVHEVTSAREILADFPEGIDALITGVGTGGHITGVGRVLKRQWPSLLVVAVEPARSAILSGGAPGTHRLMGIGPGFIPRILDREVIDRIEAVTDADAFKMTQRVAREEGIMVGPSTGASLAAVQAWIPRLSPGARILTYAYDTGERYLSVEGLY